MSFRRHHLCSHHGDVYIPWRKQRLRRYVPGLRKLIVLQHQFHHGCPGPILRKTFCFFVAAEFGGVVTSFSPSPPEGSGGCPSSPPEGSGGWLFPPPEGSGELDTPPGEHGTLSSNTAFVFVAPISALGTPAILSSHTTLHSKTSSASVLS